MQLFTDILEMQGPDEPPTRVPLVAGAVQGLAGDSHSFPANQSLETISSKGTDGFSTKRDRTPPKNASREKMVGNKGGRKGRGARHGPTVAPGGCGDSLRPQSQQGQRQVTAPTWHGLSPQTPRNNLAQGRECKEMSFRCFQTTLIQRSSKF